MIKYKYKKFDNKNILYSLSQIKKQQEEEKQREKEEKLNTLKILQEEIYGSDSDKEKSDLENLLEMLEKIKTKNKLKEFVKEYKDVINNLDKEEKNNFLYIIQNKYF